MEHILDIILGSQKDGFCINIQKLKISGRDLLRYH